MSEVDSYREIVKNAGSIDSYMSARETIEAYHKLHDLGYEDLEDFLFEYARTGIDNKYLKFSFENHLISCDYCVERLTRYKLMFEVIDEYGEEAFAIAKAKALLEKAEAYQKEGKLEEAIKCYQEALEFRPGDEEIQQKIATFKGKLPLEINIDGIKKVIQSIRDTVILPISKTARVIITLGGELVFDFHLENEMTLGFNKMEGDIIEFERGDLIIQIQRGKTDDKLIIRKK